MTRLPAGRRPGPLPRALILVVAAGAALGLGALLLEQLGIDVPRQLWLARVRLLGKERVGIWRADPRYGWTHIPGSSGRQREVPDFDVRYHIGPDGQRLTPGTPAGESAAVLFLGGSFTFGHGVEDDEAWPALLQRRWQRRRCVNAAVNGWGTTQALLTLEDKLAGEQRYELVVYGFISHHVQRNYLRRDWLEVLQRGRGRLNPWFELEEGRLVFQGLADPALDGLASTRELHARELRITRRLLSEMKALCAAHGVRFTVVYLADGVSKFPLEHLTEPLGEQAVIDLRPVLNFDELHFEHNFHYSAYGHRQVANALAEPLEALLEH